MVTEFLFDKVGRCCEELDGARDRFGQTAHTDGRKSGTAVSTVLWELHSMTLPPGSSSSQQVDHRAPVRGNPDASHSSVERGNGGCVRRGQSGRDGWFGSACPPPGSSEIGPLARSRARRGYGRGGGG